MPLRAMRVAHAPLTLPFEARNIDRVVRSAVVRGLWSPRCTAQLPEPRASNQKCCLRGKYRRSGGRQLEQYAHLKRSVRPADARYMRFIKLVFASTVSVVVVNACADNAVRDVGRTLVDAGEALGGRSAGDPDHADGGSTERDAGLLAEAAQGLVDAGTALMDAAREQVPNARAETPLTATNGSRIKLRRTTHAGSDGTRYEEPWLSYYDSTLGVTCQVLPTADGKQRCVPQPSAAANVAMRFADASCTVRLALMRETCNAPTYAFGSDDSSKTQCEGTGIEITRSTYRFYRLSGAHTGQEYGKDNQGVCKPTAATEGYQSYLVGAEMQPSEFVEFTSSSVDVP
jgi:hypothetical protein